MAPEARKGTRQPPEARKGTSTAPVTYGELLTYGSDDLYAEGQTIYTIGKGSR